MGQIFRLRGADGRSVSVEDIPDVANAMDQSFEDRAWAKIQQSDAMYGDALPWSKTHEKLRFRPGEVTAWIGPNGEGKSLLLGYLASHWALQQTRVLMCSLEMDVGIQLKRISRQLLCTESPKRIQFEMLLVRLLFLNFLDYVGHIAPFKMLEKVSEYGQKFSHIFIDNLTLIVPPGHTSDESAAVFVRGLMQIARDTGCHVHLVGHIRKPEEGRRLNRYDWRGTGACPDMVHNVLIVQANEKKRRLAEKGDYSKAEEADVFIDVDKQRNGEFHGRMHFWWRPSVLRLVEYGTDQPEAFDPCDTGRE